MVHRLSVRGVRKHAGIEFISSRRGLSSSQIASFGGFGTFIFDLLVPFLVRFRAFGDDGGSCGGEKKRGEAGGALHGF